jgi:hypothetical protein
MRWIRTKIDAARSACPNNRQHQILQPHAETDGRPKEDQGKPLNLALTIRCDPDRMKALLPILLLAGCASAAPEFMGASRTDVTVDGRTYTVFQKGERVEVIRLGYATRGEHQDIRATMIEIIPRVTGCALRESTVVGDSGEMRATLNCPS